MTRIEQFSSAHRLHNKCFDVEKNKSIFGKCDNVHGHNYKLELTVKGKIDPDTGMLMNIVDLKKIIDDTVFLQLDHKNIDDDVTYFRDNNIVSSCENLCVFIWKQIEKCLNTNVQMHCVKLYETEKNVAEFYGEYN